jgi:hypothetical protein
MLTVLGAAGCAATSAQSRPVSTALPGADDCVLILTIQNWDIIDPSTLIVYAPTPKDAYLIKLLQPAPDLSSHEDLGFEAGNHDGQVCGHGGDMLVRASVRQQVAITAVHALRTSEVKQLKATAKSGVKTPAAAASASARQAQPDNH